MNISKEFKIASISTVQKLESFGWIRFHIEVGESENLSVGEAGIATIPQYICRLTTLGQQHVADIHPFIVSA